jgi:hypothetical protein
MGTTVSAAPAAGSGLRVPRSWFAVHHSRHLLCGLLLTVACPVLAVAQERYAVLVSGVAGGEKYATQQQKWRTELAAFLATNFAFSDANVVVLEENSDGSSKSTAENVQRLFGDLRRRVTRDDTVFVVLVGHGTYDGIDAKFNLVGPDLSAAEWKGLLDALPSRLVVVNTTESSFPFLEQLSRAGRVIITATDSAQQRFATVFPEYFIRSLADFSSDLDKNGRVSIWEAFATASAGVKQHYEQRGQLPTERPLLDDNGDGVGREAEAPGDDGAVARALYFNAEPQPGSGDPERVALERRRLALEKEIEGLKSRRSTMTDQEYQAELERIFIELAKIAQEIRKRS